MNDPVAELTWPAASEMFAPSARSAPPGVTIAALNELTPQDRADWADLSRRGGENNVFVTDWFMEAAIRQCDPDHSARLVLVRTADNQLAGVVPINGARWFGRLPVPHTALWSSANQFLNTPLVAPGQEANFWASLLAWLDRRPDAGWLFHARMLAPDDPVTMALEAHCRASGRPIYRIATYDRPARRSWQKRDAVPVKGARKQAARLRNLARRLERDHGPLELRLAHSGPSDWLHDFVEMERAGWKGRNGSALACETGTEKFFRRVVRRGWANGTVRLASLDADGQTIAMNACFVTGRRGFAFKMTYDEAYAAYAPGLLLMQHVARLLDGQPDVDFDTCCAPDGQHCRYLWPDRRPLADYVVALGGAGRRAATQAMLAARSAWQGMRPDR